MFNINSFFYTQILNLNSIKKYNLSEIYIINYLVSLKVRSLIAKQFEKSWFLNTFVKEN